MKQHLAARPAREAEAICIIPNCNRTAPAAEPFCSLHRSPKRTTADYERGFADAMAAKGFPQPRRKDGEPPCGECHLKPGETCDICGAKSSTGGSDGR